MEAAALMRPFDGWMSALFLTLAAVLAVELALAVVG